MLGLAIAACSTPKKRRRADDDDDDVRPQKTSTSSVPSAPKPAPTNPTGPSDPIGPNDPPIIPYDKLEHAVVSPAEGTLAGVLEARSVVTHSGCTDRGTARKWLVVASGGKFYPLKIVDATRIGKLRAEARDPKMNGREGVAGDILSPDDGAVLGLLPGQRIQAQGVFAPVIYSGTIAAGPIFGLCTERINHA